MGEQLHRETELPLLLPLPAVSHRAHGGRVLRRPPVRAGAPTGPVGAACSSHVSLIHTMCKSMIFQ